MPFDDLETSNECHTCFNGFICIISVSLFYALYIYYQILPAQLGAVTSTVSCFYSNDIEFIDNRFKNHISYDDIKQILKQTILIRETSICAKNGWLSKLCFQIDWQELFTETCEKAKELLGPSVIIMDNAAYHKKYTSEADRISYWQKLPAKDVVHAWRQEQVYMHI